MYVESFKRAWERLSEDFFIEPQYNIAGNPNVCMKLNNVKIYDTKQGFVGTKQIIRNVSDKWAIVSMSNGRTLECTIDHPFATERGRIEAKDLVIGDKITINHTQPTGVSVLQYETEYAWFLGVMLCDGSLSSTVNACFGLDEDDIVNKVKQIAEALYNIDCKIRERHREEKGDYKEILIPSIECKYNLIKAFEGINKKERHIPNQIFSMNKSIRLAFLAGMIDADGYINDSMKLSKVQIGSVNKELALQQLVLMQSLDMSAYLYVNHYDSKNKDKVRYRVECIPTEELINALQCKKKRDNFKNNIRSNKSVCSTETATIKSIQFVETKKYSYDVTTESDHFEVSGIYSHNCRSFLTPWKDENGKYKWYGRLTKEELSRR